MFAIVVMSGCPNLILRLTSLQNIKPTRKGDKIKTDKIFEQNLTRILIFLTKKIKSMKRILFCLQTC